MDAVYIDIDNVLVGRSPFIDSNNFYGAGATGPNEQKAISCIRYILEDILGWTPDESVLKFDSYMIDLLKMDKLVRYINFPTEIPYGHPRYILSLLYPDKVHINNQKMVEEVYSNVLSVAEDDTTGLKQFPREYFLGGDGFKRFCYCINYLLENYMPMESVDEIYKCFGSPKGKKLLCDFRLKVPADQFSIDMLEVIRYITREEPDGEFYYTFYKFMELYDKVRRTMLKDAKVKDADNHAKGEKIQP